jgi:hypothetical protein
MLFCPCTVDEARDTSLPVPIFTPCGGELGVNVEISVELPFGASKDLRIVVYSNEYSSRRAKLYVGPFVLPPGSTTLRAFCMSSDHKVSACTPPTVFLIHSPCAVDDQLHVHYNVFSFEPTIMVPPVLFGVVDSDMLDHSDLDSPGRDSLSDIALTPFTGSRQGSGTSILNPLSPSARASFTHTVLSESGLDQHEHSNSKLEPVAMTSIPTSQHQQGRHRFIHRNDVYDISLFTAPLPASFKPQQPRMFADVRGQSHAWTTDM